MNEFSSRLVAHRGYMEAYPENSWRGIQAALELGAMWVEFDIQMHTPGRFVLLHDVDFRRTANSPLALFRMTEQQLEQISIHEPARLGTAHAPEPVAWLHQVLAHLPNYPTARVMVEIKEESLHHWGLVPVMQSLLPILNRFSAQCVLISFSYEALNYAKENSHLEVGWVLRRYDHTSLDRAAELKPEYLICNYTKLPEKNALASGPWIWMVYDITDPQLAGHWVSRGIDLIETRDIGKLII